MGEKIFDKNFKETLYKDIMPKIYGIGAAVVILGAMFKILNWPGADLMIGAGLTTEAVIFFLSAFEPQHKEYDWSKVYPQLNEEYETEGAPMGSSVASSNGAYKKELSNLAKTIKKLNDAYTKELDEIDNHLKSTSKLYSSGNKTVEEMAKASKQAEEFRLTLQDLSQKVAALNQIYDNTLNALKR